MSESEVQETFTDKAGAVHDAKTGKIVKAAPGAAFDSKRGREMALRRAELLRQKTRKGVEQGLQRAIEKKTGVMPTESIQFPEAHKEIVATLVDEVVMNKNERGKGRIDAYRTLLEIEGSLGNIKKPDQGDVAGIQISLSPDAAKFMIAGLLRARERATPDTIEGSFKVTDDE